MAAGRVKFGLSHPFDRRSASTINKQICCNIRLLITVWVVSKNESNCLLENKMVSILNWRCQITVVCSVKHFMVFYLAILPLPMQVCMYIINSQFLTVHCNQKTCQVNQIITVNSSMNAPISEASPKK